MCSIFGALVWNVKTEAKFNEVNNILECIYRSGHIRGRDGRGYTIQTKGTRSIYRDTKHVDHAVLGEPALDIGPRDHATIIGNTRAEPTTEYVKEKSVEDQQPYGQGDWQIVHNGTIANDKQIRELSHSFLPTNMYVHSKIDSAAIVEALECEFIVEGDYFEQFKSTIKRLKGSFAILAMTKNDNELFVAANYRPIWYITIDGGIFFASTRDSFPPGYNAQMVSPYSMTHVYVNESGDLRIDKLSLNPPTIAKHKVLVICSGGLDSVVSATYVQRVLGHDVELMHFIYGSRAQGPEVKAIEDVAKHLNVPLHFKAIPSVWDTEDSNLLQSDGTIAGGEEGAEFAHEWVPARNLVMLAVATAYAEAKGFAYIALGNNLEEAGAYPDNEPEFIERFNDLLPFAVGDGKKVTVFMPVGNLMKHEIVKLGAEIEAPMHLTWSCYRAGKLHCGKCGPCFMRRTAFEINNLAEVIDYEV